MNKGIVLGIVFLFLSVTITLTIGLSNNDDTTPPVTTHTLDPLKPDGENGWYVSDVNVTLTAIDYMSGVNTTYYSINSEPFEIYNSPFTLTEDGLYNIVYFSVDNAGNMEFPKLAHVKVDQTPPFVNLTLKLIGNEMTGYHVVNTVIAVDHMSGMERVEFYLNDNYQTTITGEGPIYQWIYTVFCYLKSTKACAFDNAGNMVYDEGIPKISPIYIQQSIQPYFLRLLERFPLLVRFLNTIQGR